MTIKDIAKQCSVSVSTVSRVLNGKPDVSDDVRRKVQAVIDACNYIPNDSARVLVRTKSEAIGLVVRGVSNPFYTDIIHAIEKTVTDAGFSLVMQQIPSCGDEVQRAAVMEREKRLQGIIFLGGRFDYTPEDLTMLNVPFVCCSYSNQYGTLRVGEYSAVSIADEETARQAQAHGFDYFGTTLTVSPHKDAQRLNAIGAELAQQYGVRWLPSDFKKREGYKRSIELSKQYGLYRQEYCGCLYSKPVDNAAAGE